MSVNVNYMWPTELAFIRNMSIGYRQRALRTQLPGVEVSRQYDDYMLRTYSFSTFINATKTDSRDKFLAFLQHIAVAGTPFWLPEPESRFGEYLVGIGDGVRTTWPLPFTGTPTITSVTVDGNPNKSKVIGGMANMLPTDQDASAEGGIGSLSSMPLTHGHTIESSNNLSVSGQSAIYIIPASSEPYIGVITDYISVSPSTEYTGCAYASSVMSGLRLNMYYYDSSKTYLGMNNTTVTATSWQWNPISFTATTPTDAAYIRLSVDYSNSNNYTRYFDCLGLVAGNTPDWWLPSAQVQTVTFSTAPAAGALIKVRGTGTALVKVVLDKDVITRVLSPQLSSNLQITAHEVVPW